MTQTAENIKRAHAAAYGLQAIAKVLSDDEAERVCEGGKTLDGYTRGGLLEAAEVLAHTAQVCLSAEGAAS
ncbi:MAG: hypothetical protein KGL33_02130 [Betaproteobacteria bacterium]|nr:hypothetical protein [Betaproteobacteria bacterium]